MPFFAFIFVKTTMLPSDAAQKPPIERVAQRRRPRRPPFLRVESDGVGVTSSIRPIFMPERAKARRADWAPGPGVLVPFPRGHVSFSCLGRFQGI